MKYKIPKSGSVGGKLRRIAASEISQARDALSRTASNGMAIESVHKARRHIKKMRGLLRLARPGLGRKKFERENIFFRDAGREIRAARDGVPLIEALDGLSRRSFNGETPAIVKRLRRLLVLDARKLARAIKSDGTIARTTEHLAEKRDEVKRWKLKDLTPKAARQAWQKALKAARRAFEVAYVEPTEENLHEFRKKAKNLLYETLLLRERCPGLQENRSATQKLTDLLGEDHDLALLAEAAREREGKLRSPDEFKVLDALVAARRKRLHIEAFALAKRSL